MQQQIIKQKKTQKKTKKKQKQKTLKNQKQKPILFLVFWFLGFFIFWFFLLVVAYCTQLLSQAIYNLKMATTMAETCSC